MNDLVYNFYHRDINPAKLEHLKTLWEHKRAVYNVSYSPNGEYIASASPDCTE